MATSPENGIPDFLQGKAWLAILALCIAAFLLQLALGIENSISLAFTPATAFTKPWTWVTSLFLHGSITHLFFNALAIAMFAPLLEQRFGTKRFLINYFAAGLLGNLFFYLASPSSLVPGLGASGAIFGVLGAMALLEPNMMIFMSFIPMPMWLATIVWALLELTGALGPADSIGHVAHLGGLAFGLAYTYYLTHYGSSMAVHVRNTARQTLHPGGVSEDVITFRDPNAPKP